MSHHANTEWLIAAQENFEQALDEENLGLAKAIAEDVKSWGFPVESNRMLTRINEQDV